MTQIPEHLDDVGPGWHPLLTQLHADLLPHVPRYQTIQIKEKFGELRVYLAYEIDLDAKNANARYDAACDLVDAAEAASARICEDCGQPGVARGGYWIRTLCDGCVGGTSAA